MKTVMLEVILLTKEKDTNLMRSRHLFWRFLLLSAAGVIALLSNLELIPISQLTSYVFFLVILAFVLFSDSNDVYRESAALSSK